jgi:lysophospholipase L1-like esterase
VVEFVFTPQTNGTVTATVTGFPEISANAATEGLARYGAEQALNAANVTRRGIGTNISAPYLKWRTAVANVRRGVSNAKLAFIGDSTTAGTGSSITAGKLRLNSHPSQIAAMFTSYGIPGGLENVFGTAAIAVATYNDKVTLANGATVTAGNLTLGGGIHQLTASTHTFTYTPATNCDTYDVYHIKTGGTGTSTINIAGGGTLATVTGTLTGGGVVKTTVTGTLGLGPLNVVWSSGTNYVLGVDAYNSAIKQVSCWNMGASGAKADQIASTSNGYTSRSALATLAPDMSVIDVGINDWVAGTAMTSFRTSIQQIIDTARISGDAMLVVPVPSGDGTLLSSQRAYADTIQSIAADNGLRCVDMLVRWGSYSSANGAGFYNDTLHPTGIGYADKAAAIFRALEEIAE